MVYKKSYRKKKTFRKRKYVRKNRLRNVVPTGAAPVARKHIVRLKYCDTKTFSVAPDSVQSIVFRLNSLYDPDETSTGHQPYGFDQLSALFNRYRVYKFSWHVNFAGSNNRLHMAVCPINGNTTFGDFISLAEQPLAISKAMSFDGGFPVNFKGRVYLPKLSGVTSVQYKTDDRYSAIVTGDPAEIMNLHIMVYNPTTGLDSVTTSCNVTLIYHSELFDPRVLDTS